MNEKTAENESGDWMDSLSRKIRLELAELLDRLVKEGAPLPIVGVELARCAGATVAQSDSAMAPEMLLYAVLKGVNIDGALDRTDDAYQALSSIVGKKEGGRRISKLSKSVQELVMKTAGEPGSTVVTEGDGLPLPVCMDILCFTAGLVAGTAPSSQRWVAFASALEDFGEGLKAGRVQLGNMERPESNYEH